MAKNLFKDQIKLHDGPEEWRDIVGYEGHYQVSNLGRIRGLDRTFLRNGFLITVRGRILRPGTSRGCRGGYCFVGLCNDGKVSQLYIHRLVAQAFISNPDNLPCINHKNRNIHDNNVENLEWCTYQQNVTYMGAHLLRGERKRKPILVFNPDGTLFGEFACCQEVADALGIWPDTVYRYMAGKHKCEMGYTFKYKNHKYEPRTESCTLQ